MPDCMLTTVFVPMTLGGRLMSTRGRRAARAKSASAEIVSPGAITPPTYSALLETRSNVVAVPKSTMIVGPPHVSYAATDDVVTRSAQLADDLLEVFCGELRERLRLRKRTLRHG